MRIERIKYFIELAKLTAKRGTCNRLQVGCVLVNSEDNRIAAVGYNSSISKTDHCSDNGCLMHNGHCIRCPHAEIAALVNLPHRFNKLSCFLTHQPCKNCYIALAAANVKEIIYLIPYKDESRDLIEVEIMLPMLQYEETI